MKKSKILLVAVLAVVLCFVCITTQTFSWFTLPRENKGDSLQWSEIAYNASTNTGITMATYESTDDGKTFGETAVTSLTNSSTGIAAGNRKYYRTDITNSSTSAQSVSLYLSSLGITTGSSGNFYLGVNSPLRTYKEFGTTSSQKVVSEVNKKNVYVGFNTTQTYTASDYKIYYWNGSGLEGDEYVTSDKIGTGTYTVSSYSNYTETYNMYPVTIPYSADAMNLQYNNGYVYDAGNNNDIDAKNTVIWFHYGNAYHSAYMKSGEAAGIKSFYSSATVAKGATTNIAATGQGTISYSTSNSSIATVSSSGVVTGVGTGTATITVTSKGVYGDTITSTCKVTVTAGGTTYSDVPIVTNLRIGPRSSESNTTESVYWYIKNDAETGTLKYTISDMYVTL